MDHTRDFRKSLTILPLAARNPGRAIFSIGAGPIPAAASQAALMSDPTPAVLALCFLIAVAIGAAGVCLHFGRRQAPAGPPRLPTGKVETWFYRPADLIGPGLVVLVYLGLFLLSLGMPKVTYKDLNAPVLLFNIGLQAAIAGGMALIAMQRTSLDLWLGLRWQEWRSVLLIAPAAVLLMWAVFWGIEATGYIQWMESLGAETIQETVRLFQESDDFIQIGLLAVTAVVVAPLCEEIVFRGLFYPVMKKFSGPWLAALCSALVFAAAHGNLTVLLPLFILGILLVFVYEKTGSIWAPIAVHFCFNAATVSIQLLMRFHGESPLAHLGP